MTRSWRAALYGTLFLGVVVFVTVLWASINEQAVQKQSLPGYVLKGTIWMAGKPQEFLVQYAYSIAPDSIVVVIYRGEQDSTVAVYRRGIALKEKAQDE